MTLRQLSSTIMTALLLSTVFFAASKARGQQDQTTGGLDIRTKKVVAWVPNTTDREGDANTLPDAPSAAWQQDGQVSPAPAGAAAPLLHDRERGARWRGARPLDPLPRRIRRPAATGGARDGRGRGRARASATAATSDHRNNPKTQRKHPGTSAHASPPVQVVVYQKFRNSGNRMRRMAENDVPGGRLFVLVSEERVPHFWERVKFTVICVSTSIGSPLRI